MSYEERKHSAKAGDRIWGDRAERKASVAKERHHVKRYTHVLVRRIRGSHPDQEKT